MDLNGRETVIVAILVLFLGKFLNQRISFLQSFNIPEPVTGGVIASVLFSALYFFTGFSFEFFLASRDNLLIAFFTTIGLQASASSLYKGGKPLAILLVLAVVYLFLQNFTGLAVAIVTDLPLEVGLIGGSVSLSGGHGTAIAWAETFSSEYHVENAMGIGVACATFGLVLGGVVGGPIAKSLIQKFDLESAGNTSSDDSSQKKVQHGTISYDAMLKVIFVLFVCIGIGTQLNILLAKLGLQLPDFVTCLFAGILVTNIIPNIFPDIKWQAGSSSLSLLSELSLGLFLAISLMSLQLWTLIDLAGPILAILFAQLVAILLFTRYVVFYLLGKNYDAAVISAGYAGLALGATPTAIANMTAVTNRFGASPLAFIVVPLVGAFFIDISNALIIKTLLSMIS